MVSFPTSRYSIKKNTFFLPQTAINKLFGVVRVVNNTSARKRIFFWFFGIFIVSFKNSNALSTLNIAIVIFFFKNASISNNTS